MNGANKQVLWHGIGPWRDLEGGSDFFQRKMERAVSAAIAEATSLRSKDPDEIPAKQFDARSKKMTKATYCSELCRVNRAIDRCYFGAFCGNFSSKARFNSSTLTRASPRNPN